MTEPGGVDPDLELELERWEDDGGATRSALPVPEDIEQTVHAWWQAWANKNLAALEELADEEYSEYSGLRKWQCAGKRALLEAAKRSFRESDVDSFHIRDLAVRSGLWHGDVVVCEYYFSVSGRRRGEPFEAEGFATDVLVQRRGRWKYFSHHSSLIESRKKSRARPPHDEGARKSRER